MERVLVQLARIDERAQSAGETLDELRADVREIGSRLTVLETRHERSEDCASAGDLEALRDHVTGEVSAVRAIAVGARRELRLLRRIGAGVVSVLGALAAAFAKLKGGDR